MQSRKLLNQLAPGLRSFFGRFHGRPGCCSGPLAEVAASFDSGGWVLIAVKGSTDGREGTQRRRGRPPMEEVS